MASPLLSILTSGSLSVAGPRATVPSAILNLLPWHGQLIVPPSTSPTWQPACVHSAEKHMNVSAVGRVTTMFRSLKILPPPTGMSVFFASTAPPALLFPALL